MGAHLITKIQYINSEGTVILDKWECCHRFWNVTVLPDGIWEPICRVECDYVHELQHVLRLGGLNELADSLKVSVR